MEWPKDLGSSQGQAGGAAKLSEDLWVRAILVEMLQHLCLENLRDSYRVEA
jgi:hypothetical protein